MRNKRILKLMNGPIRLACTECDTEDADGVFEIPPGWQYVDEVYDLGGSQWWNHVGQCPECHANETERMRKIAESHESE